MKKVAHKGKAFRISRARLNEELIPPAAQSFEAFRVVHVVHQNTTIGSAIEGNAEGLKPFLACGIPDLMSSFG